MTIRPLSELKRARSQLMQALRLINDAIDHRVNSPDTCVKTSEIISPLRSCRKQHRTVCIRCNMAKSLICQDSITQKTSL